MSRVLLMVGTRKGAFFLESDADRTDWAIRGPRLKGWDVSDLLADQRSGSTPQLLAAVNHFVYGPTVHRSTDLGESFEQVAASPTYPETADREVNQVWSIVPGHPDEPDVLYAGVDEAGLFVSHDGGDHWEEIEGLSDHETRSGWFPGKGGLCCHSILPDPTDPDRILVGISAVGVFRTDDGGATWTLQNSGLGIAVPDEDHEQLGSCVHALRRDSRNPQHLYQQNHMGVYRSTNGGDHWERIDDGLPSSFGFPLVTHTRESGTVYTVPLESGEYRMTEGGKPAVYRTTDAGESWERLDDGLPDRSWTTVLRQAMTMDSLDTAGVYVGTTGGRIFYSSDEGERWETIDCHLPRINSLSAVVID